MIDKENFPKLSGLSLLALRQIAPMWLECLFPFFLDCISSSNASISISTEWFDFIGAKAEPGFPGSPYAIEFKLVVPESSGMELMNVSVYSCGDTSLGCSCGDCPSSPVCSNPEPPSPKKKPCSIRILSIEVGFDKITFYLSFSTVFLWDFFFSFLFLRVTTSRLWPLVEVIEQ